MLIHPLRQSAIQLKRLIKSSLEYRHIDRYTTHIAGYQNLERTANDCIVVALMRNAEAYIQAFIEYHLSLGFRHIFLLDNGSEDASIDLARGYGKVTIYQCLLPYQRYKDELKRYLARRFSYQRWCLIADVDEFFRYPGDETLSLGQFISYLNRYDYDAVLLQMLDMYPAGPIEGGNQQRRDGDFLTDHCWFEIDSIQRRQIPAGLENHLSNPDLRIYFGGVRARVFQTEPYLSKFCLIRPNARLYQVNHHLVSFAKVADISAALLHYKFLNDFPRVVAKAVAEKQYFQGSAEYQRYQDVLRETEQLTLRSPHSVQFETTQQLVDLGVLAVSDRYQSYYDILQV